MAIALISFGVAFLAHKGEWLRPLELTTIDVRFSIRGERTPPANLVVVAIDDETFDELIDVRWPFPRTLHAAVIRRIAADDPDMVAFDIEFSEPGDSKHEDVALIEAIRDADGQVVLATTDGGFLDAGRFRDAGQGRLDDIGGRLGNSLFPEESGGVIRRVAYSVDRLKSFSVAATETALGRKVGREEFGKDGAWIDYYGPPGTIRTVSFSQVARANLGRGFFRDKLVVVGPTAPALLDLHPTPASGSEDMSGAEIHANAISTVLRGLPLEAPAPAVEVILLVLFAVAVPIAAAGRSPLWGLAVAIGLAGGYLVASQLAFNAGTVLPVITPVAGLTFSSVAALALGYHFALTDLARQRVRDVFARFAPEQVVDEALTRAGEDLRLRGVRREGTVMFSDLRGFTAFAESLTPDRVIQVLNRYLSEMSEAIMEPGGTLVTYMGDGIMAVFGAPIEQDDHADRALSAARDMLSERLPHFNRWIRSEGLGPGFRMGIGLNTGSVMSGLVGSERRLEYTAVGDTTNTAARLEAMTKETAHQLFLADSTRAHLRTEPADLVFVDTLGVRGKGTQIKVWTIRPDEESVPDADTASNRPV